MSRAINYEKQPYKHNADRNFVDKKIYREHSMTPTKNQTQYAEHLQALCEKNDISNGLPLPGSSREAHSNWIRSTMWKLRKAGVRYENPKKPKFKFDKDGNVIDGSTGKIVRRRDA